MYFKEEHPTDLKIGVISQSIKLLDRPSSYLHSNKEGLDFFLLWSSADSLLFLYYSFVNFHISILIIQSYSWNEKIYISERPFLFLRKVCKKRWIISKMEFSNNRKVLVDQLAITQLFDFLLLLMLPVLPQNSIDGFTGMKHVLITLCTCNNKTNYFFRILTKLLKTICIVIGIIRYWPKRVTFPTWKMFNVIFGSFIW